MPKNYIKYFSPSHRHTALLLCLLGMFFVKGAAASDQTSPFDLILVLNGPVQEEILAPVFEEHSLIPVYRFLAEDFYWVHPGHEMTESEIQSIRNESEILEVFRKGQDYFQAASGTEEYQQQYYLDRQNSCYISATRYAYWDIDAKTAWQHETSRSTRIAVLDGGMDIEHPDLAGVIWNNPNDPVNGLDDDGNGLVDDTQGWDFCQRNNDVMPYYQDINHATQMAGLIAAEHNHIGIKGVANKARIMPIVVTRRNVDGLGGEPVDAICSAAGLDYAISQGVDIICLPWWGYGDYEPVRRLIEKAASLGIAVVVAAGNGDYDLGGLAVDLDREFRYPACYDFSGEMVMTVTALATNDYLLGYVNWGDETVDIASFGQWIYSTNSSLNPELYGFRGMDMLTNTSSACALATGALAQLYSVRDELDMEACIQRLYSNSVKESNILYGVKEGRILQLGNAINDRLDVIPPSRVNDFEIIEVGNHHALLQWTATGGDGMTGPVRGYDVAFGPGHYEDGFWRHSQHHRLDISAEPGEIIQFEYRGVTPIALCGIEEQPYLPPSGSFVVAVAAVDSAYNHSPYSTILEFTATIPILSTETELVTANLTTGELRTEEFLVSNSGDGPFPFYVEFDPPTTWLDVSPASGVLAPGQTTTFTVTFDASEQCEAGAFSWVHLRYAEDYPMEEISVGCLMTIEPAAQLNTSPTEIAFGLVPLHETSTTIFNIHNTGCLDLLVEDIQVSDASHYYFSPASIEIPAGMTQEVMAFITPTELGHFNDTLTIESNDPFHPLWTMDISGEVVSSITAVDPAAHGPRPPLVIPNPANPSTTISFEHQQAGDLRLSIYDIRGALVRQIRLSGIAAGVTDVRWDGKDEMGNCVSSGLYLCEAYVGGHSIFSGLKITMLE